MIGLRTLLLILVIVVGGLVIVGPLTVDAEPSDTTGEDADVGGSADVTVVTGGISLPSLVGTAAAQEGSESNPDGANEGEQQEEEEDKEPYQFAFSDSLRLIDSEWEGKTYIATFEADRSTTITITDSGRSSAGNEVVVVDQETRTIPAGDRVEVEFSVVEDRQVSISGDGELILQGHDDSIDTSPDQDRTFTGIGLTGVVILVTIICSALAIRQIRKNSIKRLF